MNPKKVVRSLLPKQAITVAETSYRKGRVYALQLSQGFPARKLRVIAITGTNGKTTTANYINAMLKSAGYSTALFSTAVIELAGATELNRTHRTVPLTAELITFFTRAKEAKVDFVIMEATSQALDQHKFIGMPVEIAIMTNLTQDHLDYHGNMEAYAHAKARLFNKYLHPKVSILNADDSWYDFFRGQAVGEVQTYGEASASTVHLKAITLTAQGSEWQAQATHELLHLRTVLPGRFNVQNATAAAAAGLAVGLSKAAIEKGIAALKAVPGRMERVEAGQTFTVLVDYAHTPDALKNVLQAAHGIVKGKVIAVFGATGDRDRAKRPIMGKIVAEYADFTVLTDDETYTEDPAEIRAEVRIGLAAKKAQFTEVGDRRKAIATAFKHAKKGDVVVLAGMGHQDTRNMGGKLEPWKEADVALQLLRDQSR